MTRPVSDGQPRLAPADHSVPGRSGQTKRGNQGALRQILREKTCALRASGAARVADKTETYIGMHRKLQV